MRNRGSSGAQRTQIIFTNVAALALTTSSNFDNTLVAPPLPLESVRRALMAFWTHCSWACRGKQQVIVGDREGTSDTSVAWMRFHPTTWIK